MEAAVALKSKARPEASSPAAWFLADDVEFGGILASGGDELSFSVEDLFDFGPTPESGSGEVEDDDEDDESDIAGGGREAENSGAYSGPALAPPPAPSEIDIPVVDEDELEWVSRIMDDSLSELPPSYFPLPKITTLPAGGRLKCRRRLSAGALLPAIKKAKRSKRSRTAGWVGRPYYPSAAELSSWSSSSSCSSPAATQNTASFLLAKIPKKRGRKPKIGGGAAAAERRCSHCGTEKTPQWRTGPMGAKTLCNACGVRYKSGRLLPEYRPACSPSFVSRVHSNSHRKVLEMRRSKEIVEQQRLLVADDSPPVSCCRDSFLASV